MTHLSADAALVADTSLIVRARFIEAADTMAHQQVHGIRPSDKSGLWPAVPVMVDADYRSPYRPTAAAISRAEEAMQGWLLDFIADQEQRVLVARWSASIAVPQIVGTFRAWCKNTGRVRRTAERRLDVAFQSMAGKLLKSPKLLHEPDWRRVSPLLPDWGRDIDMVAERVTERQSYWRADDAKPVHLPEVHQPAKRKAA